MVGGRRLSELLREQQEPFLLLLRGGSEAAPCCSVEDKGARSSWGKVARRALRRCRWDGLAVGCFPCATRRESFSRLPRAGRTHCHDAAGTESDGGDDGSARRLSPVSVLDVLRCSGEEEESSSSPTLSDWEEEEEDDDDKPSSTSGSSPPPDPLTDKEEWRKVVSSWEKIAGDIARVPALAELDVSTSMSMSAREWHGEAEAERVGASVEAMIFEEMSAEAVRDMVEL